jgi:radical SAM superfamily enzyme YgiQ (UPF0313 family)
MLEQIGFECRLIDAPARKWSYDDVRLDIEQFSPDYIVINTAFPSVDADMEFTSVPKAINPKMKVVMVGVATTPFKDKLMACSSIDYLARLEFDFVVRDLLTVLRSDGDVSQVKGVSYKNGGQIIHNPDREWSTQEELDALPFVSDVYKRHLNIKDYALNYGYSLYPEVQILAGRGCYGQCLFCSYVVNLSGRKYRRRSIDNILDEMEWVQKNLHEVKEIFWEDDIFMVGNKNMVEFCNKYRERGIKIPWGSQARIDLTYETMKAMKKANCLHIDVGYESGNDVILNNVKKGITVSEIRQFAKDARKAHMSIHGNWVIGMTGETKETMEDTRKLIKETKADSVTVAIATPQAGTEMYNWAKENGYLLPKDYLDEYGHQACVLSYPDLSSDEIKDAANGMLKSYFLSVSYIPIALKRVFSRHGVHELNMLWRSAIGYIKYLIKEQT